jgi:TetR/AcrR family transcriptional regulator, regulator of biofilm formation and stress response
MRRRSDTNSVVRPTQRTYLPASERRSEIVQAAIELISREGLAAATTRKIANEAGVSLSTLHYSFGSKDALVGAVIEAITAEIGTVARSGVTTDAGLAATIEGAVKAFWSLVEETPGLQTMQYELTIGALRAGEHELARSQYAAYVAVAEELFATAAEEAGEQPAIPVHELARFVVAGLDGLILQHLSHPDLRRSRRQVQLLARSAIDLAGVAERSRTDG